MNMVTKIYASCMVLLLVKNETGKELNGNGI